MCNIESNLDRHIVCDDDDGEDVDSDEDVMKMVRISQYCGRVDSRPSNVSSCALWRLSLRRRCRLRGVRWQFGLVHLGPWGSGFESLIRVGGSHAL